MDVFNKILGNDHIKNSLKSAVNSGKISHAYIISGCAGMGKKLISYTFAKELAHAVDIITIKPVKASIGIDEVREQITHKMRSKPYSSKYKVFVIENADKLTASAQNALLKTIEEPEHYGVFLLICENYNTFLPTIISRAQVLTVTPLPYETVFNYLIENGITTDENAEVFAAYSEGSIGRAVKLAKDEGFKILRSDFLRLIEAVETGDELDAIKIAEEITNNTHYKDKVSVGLEVLMIKYLDALIYKSTNRLDLMTERSQNIKDFTHNKTLMQLTKDIEAIDKAKTALSQNANARLTLEVMLLEINGNNRSN